MSDTKEITAGPAWLAVAAGAGTATITPLDYAGRWAVSTVGIPATIERGHAIAADAAESMDLAVGETLYVRGRGEFSVTAANPLP